MKHRFIFLSLAVSIGCALVFSQCQTGPGPAKRIVILAGPKSHPAGMHEYIKSARLIKVMLDHSDNIKGVDTRICYDGWPEDDKMLDSADLILVLSDGRDGPNGQDVPFFTDQRMPIIEKQIKRGCGLMTFHYSTFAPDKYGPQILDWTGGYFDWQNDAGEREWYSAIQFQDDTVQLMNTSHPVMRGVKPFRIWEEYYYNLRFKENDKRLTPLIQVNNLTGERPGGGVVAWAVERENGGRGFATTLGHFYSNWKNDNYRKFMLNSMIWAAGVEVPEGGVNSTYYLSRQAGKLLTGKNYRALILTGNNHPSHDWKRTTPVLRNMLEDGSDISADVSTNIHDLTQYDLRDYDLLVFNYCNWEDQHPLWDSDKQALTDYVNNGGGLMFIHFADGAFHYSLPGADSSDWPYYRKLCRRVWNHKGKSSHDAYGKFQVSVTDGRNEIVRGIHAFQTSDELYFNQEGEEEIHIIMTAVSKTTGKEEPISWTYELNGATGKTARVFQTLLGHDTASLAAPELKIILQRAAVWTGNGSRYWNDW